MHSAAALFKEGGPPLVVDRRITPEPGPNDVLIEVRAVALNPVDHYQRDHNFPPVPVYPAVIGSDTAGVVAKNGSPDYGGFQKYALAQFEGVIPLPDALSSEQGSVFPLAVLTALSAWTTIGISLDTRYTPQDKQGVLIWGGASSVGTFAIQSARTLGFTVYTTASSKHHAYLKGLGADAVFDYKDSDVVVQIVAAVKEDGTKLHTAHCVVPGALQPTLDVLKETMGDAAQPAKVAHSPFNLPPMDRVARDKHIYQCFHGWLQDGLKSGSVVPSPSVQIEGGGLEGLNAALDKLKAGVSGVKIVVPT
ncbi:hypothetical protein VTI74DRAFT_833 [Chaetomium olivicolor]